MSPVSACYEIATPGDFYLREFTLIPAWISIQILYKVWDEITYTFPNVNGETG